MGVYTPNSLVLDAQHHGVITLPPDVNASDYDCTVEPFDADPDDLVSYLGGTWRRGRGPIDDPLRPAAALRLDRKSVV